MANPTEKQKRFAEAIADKLGIPMPEEETSKAYWQYIQDNREAYYDKVNASATDKPKRKRKNGNSN